MPGESAALKMDQTEKSGQNARPADLQDSAANAEHPPAGKSKPGKWDFLVALLVLGAVIAQGAYTIRQVGISWDEPYYFIEAKDYLSWFQNLGTGDSFKAETLKTVFGFKLKLDNHPTLFKILGAASYAAFKDFTAGFWAYRMSAVFLFGLLLALVFLRATLALGRLAGIGAVLCTGLVPSFFVHGHIGATEMPLCFFWFLTVWAFESAVRNKKLIPLAGVCFGLLMSVKFTGWLLPVPLFLRAIIYDRRNSLLPAASLFIIGPIVFYLFQPDMWLHPLQYLRAFWEMSVTRNEWVPISVLFLNKIFPAYGPWYYAPFMLLVTTPVIILILFLAGAVRTAAGRFKDRFAALCLINFIFLIAMTFPPNAPKYDSVRLFLPAFVFLGFLAGCGFDLAVRFVMSQAGASKRAGAVIGIAFAVLLAAAISRPLLKVYPFGLEYYNELIGGVKGARKHGMETTYWWTVFNKDAFDAVNKKLPGSATLGFFPANAHMTGLYRELGLLREDIIVKDCTEAQFVVILSRPYWDFAGNYSYAGINPVRPEIVASAELDGVPLWVLYRTR
jgi:4-amino-4-deoxy-L-arabinose transferase-like glycosyltransferase